MTAPRKKYSPAFKAQIVQELLKEEQTLTQIASKHGVHPSQLRHWRESALTAMPANFAYEAQFQNTLQLSPSSKTVKKKNSTPKSVSSPPNLTG